MTLIVQLVLMLIPLALFAYFYARFSPWTTTIQGMTMLGQKVAWILLILHFLGEALGGYPGHEVVETVLLYVLGAIFWLMFIGLRLSQTASRPVSKKQGTGYVDTDDLERTRPRPRKR